MLFVPTVDEMYPTGARTTVHVDGLTDGLCGASRPGHFDGVTTVVAKLFSIVGPCRAYFGRKDAQQLAVIRRMTADLDLPVEVVGCPLVREPDGLAMSSRNAYLVADERGARDRARRGALHAAAEAVVARRARRRAPSRDAARRHHRHASRWCGSTTPRSSTPRRCEPVERIDARRAGRGRRVRRHDSPDRQRHDHVPTATRASADLGVLTASSGTQEAH